MTSNTIFFIGLCGGKLGSDGVGKTTAANYIVKKHNFCLCDLLSPVEQSAKKLSNWDGKKDAKGLAILNETCIAGRKINENYWLNLALAPIPADKNFRIVFDNVYFKNEAIFIKNNGGFVINIDRDDFEDMDFDFIPDFSVINNGTLEEFENKIDELINKLYNASNEK
jgi:dephospho-CoA kinase